jgi:hypothetical protein
MITCYVNCELIDQEFILDTIYIHNVIQKVIHINENQYEYNRRSTFILLNESIEQIAANFFCLRLDKKSQDLLPDKYALRLHIFIIFNSNLLFLFLENLTMLLICLSIVLIVTIKYRIYLL